MNENRSTGWMADREHEARGVASQVARMGILVAMLAVAAGAQKKTAKDAIARPTTLAQAVVVEIYEHDLGKAMAMYRAIAGDAERTGETRTQARLRLAKAYRRLGQNEEAEASLLAAAGGSGAAAKEAASILAGHGQDDGDLVKVKVQQALLAMRLTGKPDKSDLAWIGRAAVPFVIKAVDGEKADLRFITNASSVLFQLGGPEVRKWIAATRKSGDVLRKRAVIKGFRVGDKDVGRAVASFLSDADVSVRLEVLKNANRFAEAVQIIDALQDKDERVRRAAMDLLRRYWDTLDHGGNKFEDFERLLPDFEKEQVYFDRGGSLANWIAGRSVYYKTAGTSAGTAQRFPATDAARRVVLRALTFKCFRYFRFQWPALGDATAKNAYATALVEAAKKVGPVPLKKGRRSASGQGSAATIYEIMRDVMPTWDHASMGAALELVDLGYDMQGVLATWVSQNGTADDVSAVADRLQRFDVKNGLFMVCNWLKEVGAPDAVLGRLTVLADKLHGAIGRKRTSPEFLAVLRTIVSIDTRESVDFIVARIQGGSDHYLRAVEGKTDSKAEAAILQRLLVIPGTGPRFEKMRAMAFQMLLQAHTDPGDPQLFARAYELGMGDTGPCVDPNRGPGRNIRGVFYAYTSSGYGKAPRATVAARAKIMDVCLGTGRAEAFKDLAEALRRKTDPAVGDVVTRHIARCPKMVGRRGSDIRSTLISYVMATIAHGEAGAQLAVAALTDQDPTVRRAAVRSLRSDFDSDPKVAKTVLASLTDADATVRRNAARFLSGSAAKVVGLTFAMTRRLADSDPDTVIAAIRFLGSRSPVTLFDHADALLSHGNFSVRYTAAKTLLSGQGAKVIEKVGPLLVDEKIPPIDRMRLVKSLGSLMALEAVPFLLQALKSPGVQAEAQKQLEAIRFYHEESDKWNRVMQGTGFTETSAAEALIEQARQGKLAIRLAAIASLGTLAEPKTLPFLVKLIGDANEEIADAAKAAVERINRAAEKK